MYSSKIQDENFYEKLILSKDITGRTLFKIITSNGFEQLLDENDPKAENTCTKLWNGNAASKCDGTWAGISSLLHILLSPTRKYMANEAGFLDKMSNFFRPNFKVDY